METAYNYNEAKTLLIRDEKGKTVSNKRGNHTKVV